MDIQVETRNGYVIVKTSGRIDAMTSGDLEDKLIDLIDQGSTRVLVDMKEVDYISSAGLRVLLAATKKLYGTGQFALSRISDNVKEIIEMAGFSNFMQIFDNLDAAESVMTQS